MEVALPSTPPTLRIGTRPCALNYDSIDEAHPTIDSTWQDNKTDQKMIDTEVKYANKSRDNPMNVTMRLYHTTGTFWFRVLQRTSQSGIQIITLPCYPSSINKPKLQRAVVLRAKKSRPLPQQT